MATNSTYQLKISLTYKDDNEAKQATLDAAMFAGMLALSLSAMYGRNWGDKVNHKVIGFQDSTTLGNGKKIKLATVEVSRGLQDFRVALALTTLLQSEIVRFETHDIV